MQSLILQEKFARSLIYFCHNLMKPNKRYLIICVYELTWLYLVKRQGWPVSLVYATTSPGRMASHSKDSLWYPNTCSPNGQSHNKCVKSCSLRQHDGQSGSFTESSRWKKLCKDGWWPERSAASSTSSCRFLTCWESWEALRCWNTLAILSLVGGLSQIF